MGAKPDRKGQSSVTRTSAAFLVFDAGFGLCVRICVSILVIQDKCNGEQSVDSKPRSGQNVRFVVLPMYIMFPMPKSRG